MHKTYFITPVNDVTAQWKQQK